MRRPLAALLAAVLAVPASGAAQAAAPSAVQPAPGAAAQNLPLGAAERRQYVGHYVLTDSAGREATSLRVFEEGGVLLGQIQANKPSRLLHQGRHAFRPADAPAFAVVFTVEGGRATRVAVAGPGMTLRGPRDAGTSNSAASSGAASGGAGASPTDSARLFDELARADSLLFDASYVACDTARVHALLADDVEFYHDQTGLHRGAEVRADFARLARHCPRAQGVRRELVPGTLRVYPVRGYGAVQTGEHRFVGPGASARVTTARFVHVWRRDGDAWKACRILSLDHRATAPR